jgi:2-keto-3-deoxy-galactonokinase
MAGTALIAIDWGTTSARAYRHDAGGRVTGERSAPLGIQQVRDGAFDTALATLLGDWAGDPAPRIACPIVMPCLMPRPVSCQYCPLINDARVGSHLAEL